MSATDGVFLFFILILLFTPLLIILYSYTYRKEQFIKLLKLNRTDETNFKEFNRFYQKISNKYNIVLFEIVYWKECHTVIKINKDYYDVYPTGMNLIFNEDEYFTKEFKDYFNQ